MKITNIDQAKDLFEALDYYKDKLSSLSKLNVDQVEINLFSESKQIVFPQSYWGFNEAIIDNLIELTKKEIASLEAQIKDL